MIRWQKIMYFLTVLIVVYIVFSYLIIMTNNDLLSYTVRVQSTLLEEQVKRRYLIIHLGPSKTGTSIIQQVSRNSTDVLAMDNFVYLGRNCGKGTVKKHLTSLLIKESLEKVRIKEFLFGTHP